MPSNEFVHGSVGTTMTQAEFEAVGLHVFNSQATGDILYASSSIQLSRLGVATDGNPLYLASGIPAWFTGLTFANDGTKTTILGATGDYNRIGDAGTTAHTLNSEDDLMVTGELEVKGRCYFDTTIDIGDDVLMRFGASDDFRMMYDTQDANAMVVKFICRAVSANDVRVFVFGDLSIQDIDLGAAGIDFSGVIETRIAVVDADGDSAIGLGFAADDVAEIIPTGSATLRLLSDTAYTASGAIKTFGSVSLNQSGSAILMTLVDPDGAGKILRITQIDAGTQGHTVTTATAGGFDGTNNTATFNAQYETLVLMSVAADRWVIVENIGAVGLSAV